jgi:uncharacterized protein
MDLTPLIPAGRQMVESYGEGRFRISGRVFEGSVIVFPDRAVGWPARDTAGVTLESLSEVAAAGQAGAVDLLLIGCGPHAALIPAELRRPLRESGVVTEAMDTGAACRTYNVLAAEGRRVAAALIAIP